jgi:hypothetical protein
MLTTGALSAAQELLASWIAKDRNRNGSYFTSRVPKMAAYGAFISAPLGHVLIGILQRMFAGRTSLKAKILQILVSNLVVCHIAPRITAYTDSALIDFAHHKQCLSSLHGNHCWSENHSSSACDMESRLHASHEG